MSSKEQSSGRLLNSAPTSSFAVLIAFKNLPQKPSDTVSVECSTGSALGAPVREFGAAGPKGRQGIATSVRAWSGQYAKASEARRVTFPCRVKSPCRAFGAKFILMVLD